MTNAIWVGRVAAGPYELGPQLVLHELGVARGVRVEQAALDELLAHSPENRHAARVQRIVLTSDGSTSPCRRVAVGSGDRECGEFSSASHSADDWVGPVLWAPSC